MPKEEKCDTLVSKIGAMAAKPFIGRIDRVIGGRGVGRLGTGCLVIVLAASGTLARADTKQSDALWRTYFNAGIVEIEDSQNASDDKIRQERAENAIILLRSALDVGNRIDPDGPRPRMATWLLYITYFKLGDADTAKKVFDASKGVDLKKFDAGLLPETDLLESLANTYFNHAEDKSNNYADAYFSGFKCMQWETAILENALPPDDPRLAMPKGLYGLAEMRLGFSYFDRFESGEKDKPEEKESNRKEAESDLVAAIQLFQQALQVWNKNSQQDAVLAANNLRYMVYHGEENTAANSHQAPSGGENDIDGPNDVNVLLGETYQKLGDLYLDMKQEDKAQEQYKRAEAPWVTVLNAVRSKWPDHIQVAYNEDRLALLYVKEKRYSEAELLFRRALRSTEKGYGKSAADTKTLAENLIYTLQKEHQDAEAQQIAQSYSVKLN